MEKKKLKIAFLSFYSGEIYRGVETYVHEVANRLVGLSYEVTVFQNGPKHTSSRYKTISVGVPIRLSKHTESPLNLSYYEFVLKLREFTEISLSRMDSDTQIVIPTNGVIQGLPCKIWTIKNRRKIVTPGQAGLGRSDRLNLWIFPDVFIGLTNYQCQWAHKVNPFVKIQKIPNGVDLSIFKSGRGLGFGIEKPIILSVAALVDMKRLDTAIKAVSKLSKGSLVLVGKGEKEAHLKTLGEKLLPGRFKILSSPYSKMPEVYRGADLFTFPTSSWESFGIAMVEAMASGLPVVASDDPIRREIVGGAGLFINPEDTSEYACALEKALNTRWGNKPRKQAERFSWDDIAGKYDKLFKSLKTISKPVGNKRL